MAPEGRASKAKSPSVRVKTQRDQTGAHPRARASEDVLRQRVKPDAKDVSQVTEAPKKRRPKNRRVVEESEKPSRARGPALSVRVAQVRGGLSALGARLKKPGMYLFRALSVVAVIAGAVAVGRLVQHHLTNSPAFAIDGIEVRGLERMTKPELLAAAGIDVGTNVFAKSPDDVRARLLAHPWIASAEVSRRLPSHFDIEVREREPVALLVVEACPENQATTSQDPTCDDPSSLYLVSDEATVFKRLEGQDPADLPVLTGVDKKRLAEDREGYPQLLKEAVALLGEYRGAGLSKRLPIGEVHLEKTGGFSLYVGDQLTHVRLGAPPFGQKLKRMKKVFERLEREHTSAEYVYLDNELRPDRVTVRLR